MMTVEEEEGQQPESEPAVEKVAAEETQAAAERVDREARDWLSDILPAEYSSCERCYSALAEVTAKARYLAALAVVVDTDLGSRMHLGESASRFMVAYSKGLPVTSTFSRTSHGIANLDKGAEVVMDQADTPIEFDGRVRARIHAHTGSGSVHGWVTMKSIDPPFDFVQPIEAAGQREGFTEQTYEEWAQTIRDASFVDSSFQDCAALVVNLRVETPDSSEREFIALVRAGKTETLDKIAESIRRCVELRLPTLREPLHYQAMFTNLGDASLVAEELCVYERLRLMIFITDPRDAALDFI